MNTTHITQTTDAPAVHVHDLVKRYGNNIALDYLDIDVQPGEIFGLLGPNGSGKTTAINCILGLLTYDSGTIEVFGKHLTPSNYALKRQIGVVPQDVAVFNELTVEENITYFCSLYIADRERVHELVEQAIDFVELNDHRKYRPKTLSGGLLRRLNIACGIVHQPKLIFFDEPTVAVDPQSRNAILDGIIELNKRGSTIIYTSHYMEEVEQICNRIEIIDHGRSIALGTDTQLKSMVTSGETISVELASIGSNMALIEQTLDAVRALNNVASANFDGTQLTVQCLHGDNNLLDVLQVLGQLKVPIGHLSARTPTLNDVFLELTGTALRD